MRNMIRNETCILLFNRFEHNVKYAMKRCHVLMLPEHEITNQQISTIHDSVKSWVHFMAIKIMVKIVLLWRFLCSGHLMISNSVYILCIHFYFHIFQTRQYTRFGLHYKISTYYGMVKRILLIFCFRKIVIRIIDKMKLA